MHVDILVMTACASWPTTTPPSLPQGFPIWHRQIQRDTPKPSKFVTLRVIRQSVELYQECQYERISQSTNFFYVLGDDRSRRQAIRNAIRSRALLLKVWFCGK